MLIFLGRRILLAVPTLLGVALIVFLLMRAVPGDVVTNLVGLEGNVTAERMVELRRMFGLDLPVHEQFGQWIAAAVQGDLGSSLRTGRPVAADLALRFPVVAARDAAPRLRAHRARQRPARADRHVPARAPDRADPGGDRRRAAVRATPRGRRDHRAGVQPAGTGSRSTCTSPPPTTSCARPPR